MSGPTDAEARAILKHFGLAASSAESLGNCGGFSGARLWRVRTDRGEFCLKAWPSGAMSAERHADVVRLVLHARRAGLSFVPSIQLVSSATEAASVRYAGRLWDLADWMPGTADFHTNPAPNRLRAACMALARLHRVWESFGNETETCPAVIRRLVAAGEWMASTAAAAWSPAIVAGDPVSPWAGRAWRVVVRRMPTVRQSLEAWQHVALPVQPCLCDVWHDHVLFTGDEVTGLIDYGAVKPDNVAADLARLLGSFAGENQNLYNLGLDAYAAIRPLTDQERRLVPVLDQTGVVLGLANWLRRLYCVGEQPDDRIAVAERIAELVRRAESQAGVGG